MLTDRTLQIPRPAPVHLVEPEERDGAPGDVDRFHIHLRQADEIIGARIGAQQGKVAAPAGGMQRPVILGRAHRHAACPGAARVLPLGVVEILLGILVNAQRDHIQSLGFGDLLDPLQRGLHGWQTKVMAKKRVGRFPLDALHGGLRKVSFRGRHRALPLEIGQHSLGRLAAIEDPFEEAQRLGALGHRRRAAKSKAHPGLVQLRGLFGELAQQALAGFGGQAVGDAHQVGFFNSGGLQHLLDGHGRAKEHRPPAGGLGQAQEVADPGHVDTFS